MLIRKEYRYINKKQTI